MSQDPNMNNASYASQQPVRDAQYPSQQPGEDPQYPPQQPGDYGQNPPVESGGDGQKEMLSQPPTVLPRPDFPKGQSLIFFNGSNSFPNLVNNSGYTSVPLHGKFLKNVHDLKK